MARLASALALLTLIAVGCAPPAAEEAAESGDAVSAAEVLATIPRNAWIPQGSSWGQHVDDTGVAIWDVYIAFGEKREPYVIAVGRTEQDAVIVETVVDVLSREVDLRSAVDITPGAREAWLKAIGEDLQGLEPNEAPSGGISFLDQNAAATGTGRECAINVAWAVLHAAGFAAAGALTVAGCSAAVVSGPVGGALLVGFCIWQASDTVELSSETTRRIETAYRSCKR